MKRPMPMVKPKPYVEEDDSYLKPGMKDEAESTHMKANATLPKKAKSPLTAKMPLPKTGSPMPSKKGALLGRLKKIASK